MKHIYLLSALIVLFYLTSCTDDEIINKSNVGNADTEISTECGKLSSDSLEIKYMMQTDQELILADRVINKGSKFVLDLSQEEAITLLIPMEIYQKCLKHIEELNNKSEK